jgi:hypothetical protein
MHLGSSIVQPVTLHTRVRLIFIAIYVLSTRKSRPIVVLDVAPASFAPMLAVHTGKASRGVKLSILSERDAHNSPSLSSLVYRIFSYPQA